MTFDINTLSAGGINFNIALMSFFCLCQSFSHFCDFRVRYLKKYLSDATSSGFTLYHILFIPIIRNMFFILKNFWLLLLKQQTLYFAEWYPMVLSSLSYCVEVFEVLRSELNKFQRLPSVNLLISIRNNPTGL